MTDFTITINLIARSFGERLSMTWGMLTKGKIGLELSMGDLPPDDLMGIMNQCVREINKKKDPVKKLIQGPKAPVIPMVPRKDK